MVSSTPIAHTSRSLISKSQKYTKSFTSNEDKLKESSLSLSLGDSLDDISWDRLNSDFDKFDENPNECEEYEENAVKNVSTLSANLLTNRCVSPELFGDSDTLSSKSEHSSKRSSSPSPSGKMCERVNKKPFSSTSNVSLIHSEDSFMFSDDSYNLLQTDDSNSSAISSVVTKTKFKELEIGDKFVVLVIDSKNVSLIDNMLNNLIHKKAFSLNFKTEPKNLNPIQLIGSKIKPLRTVAEDICGLDMNYNNTIVSAITICFESEKTVYYVSSVTALNKFRDQFKVRLQSDSQIITFDINLCYKILRQCFQMDVQVLDSIDWFDVRIAHWILDPESNRPNSVQQMLRIYSKQFLYLFNSRNNSIETECISTALMFTLINELMTELENKNQLKAYKRIEIPSRLTIANLELNGICVDFQLMNKLLDMLNETKRQLEAKAYSITKTKFNFSKPTEIARILFENQKLLTNYYSVQKNTNKFGSKGNYERKLPKHLSTSKTALKKLCLLSDNPIPRLVMEWRKVDTAVKKSIKPVLENICIDSESGIYSIKGFCDDWSSTGRISMSEPNLIGINKDFTVEGIDLDENGSNRDICFSLRKCFVARKGYLLVSADYSQLELRILAHLSKDKLLIQVLNSGGDVFKNIASIWKSKRVEEISDDERQQSKKICYGMIYGMGEKALSEDLEVSEEEAKQFMESFISRYEGVKQFIANTVDECRERGFVETMSGRRRYLPHIQSPNSMLRSKAERQAVNSTIQGSAADLIKTAMTALQTRLADHKYMDSRIVLQMYDELMYEVLQQWSQNFILQLTESMENCLKRFRVDLPVRAKVGPNWADLVPHETQSNFN